MLIKRVETIEMSWPEIKEADAAKKMRSGDRIPLTLKTGEELEVDFTYDETGKGFFVFHDCMKEPRAMNKRNTNKGGWAKSDLRKEANGEIFDSFPDELRDLIVPTKIVQVIDGKRIECEDKLFCLSRVQVTGRGYKSAVECSPEDTQFDIFKTDRSRVKECGDNGTCYWWERDPYVTGSNYFCYVYASGYPGSYSYAYYRHGVSLGFCLNP